MRLEWLNVWEQLVDNFRKWNFYLEKKTMLLSEKRKEGKGLENKTGAVIIVEVGGAWTVASLTEGLKSAMALTS